MTISNDFELANNSQFRLLANFSTPPRAGRITALEGNGQVRVATDDPDGGDVLAWPLNGFQYAVNDVVYIAFAVNNPESAIVLGAKAPLPKLNANVLPKPYVPVDGTAPLTADWDIGEDRRILAEALRARDNEGMRFEDDGGNLGILIEDGGSASIGGVWDGRPSVISTHTHVEGDMFAGNDGANVARLRMSSNASRGFIQFNRYYDGAASQQMDSTKPSWDITLEGNSDYMSISRSPTGSATMAELFRLTTVGLALGSGVTSPLGSLHIHNGTAGLIFVTKTNIINSAQTIIPNATGDVTGVLIGFFVVQASGGAVANAFTLWPGDNLDITAGGYTMRLALNANGQLTAIRQSGSGSASLALFALWI